MHFRTAIRQHIVSRLSGAYTNLVVHNGEGHQFSKDSFTGTDGVTPRYHAIVATTDMQPTSPIGDVFVGACSGPDAEIPVLMRLEIQVIVSMNQGEAETRCDEIEEAIWAAVAVDALDIAAADGLLLEFAGEATQAASGNTEVALMTRSLQFTIAGSFKPADPTVLFAQAT